jgi:hypothetical protein
MAKKKTEIDVNRIDADELLRETVAFSTMGRILASYAARLTNEEKSRNRLLYQAIRANNKPHDDLAENAFIGRTEPKNTKRYTLAEAIKTFAEKHPREAQPLLALCDERTEETKPTLIYGFKEGQPPNHEYMINILQQRLEIGRTAARALYEQIILPEFNSQREESGLVAITMKD